jgi:Sugar-transfer associated ATP-grasp
LILNRLIYLGYYFKGLDWHKANGFINYLHRSQDLSKVRIWVNVIGASIKYNISILDYFFFKFYQLSHQEKDSYAGTGFMYEYQLKMNPKKMRAILADKILFLSNYSIFVRRKCAGIDKLRSDSGLVNTLLSNPSGKLVLKGSLGQVGTEVEVVSCSDFNYPSLIKFMDAHKYDLAEEFIVQHPLLAKLSPSGLNSVRVITQIDNDERVVVLATRLRITVNSAVDNLGAGNLAAPVNLDTGVVSGPAIYSDITKSDQVAHPISGVNIIDFELPHWDEVLKMIKQAALLYPKNRSVGWDVAITEAGPELIEGNHNWCKLLWQLPVKKGLKKELVQYL